MDICPPSPAADLQMLPRTAGTSSMATRMSARSRSALEIPRAQIPGNGIAASIRARVLIANAQRRGQLPHGITGQNPAIG